MLYGGKLMARVSFDEFTKLATIGDATSPASHQLQAGDILLHHRHSGDDGWPTGPLDPFHCSIVQLFARLPRLYDSMPADGVREKQLREMHDDCVVFRPQGNQATQDAGEKAGDLADKLHTAGVGYSDFLYGEGRALGTVLASKKFTAGTRARLEKYRKHGKPKNAICSEFVILCYQLALTEGDTHFFDIDGKYTTPHGLESYLLHHNANWLLAGKVIGQPDT
jgi:hypothetical protein